MSGWVDKGTQAHINMHMCTHVAKWVDGVNRYMCMHMNEWMDGQMTGWVDRCVRVCVYPRG